MVKIAAQMDAHAHVDALDEFSQAVILAVIAGIQRWVREPAVEDTHDAVRVADDVLTNLKDRHLGLTRDAPHGEKVEDWDMVPHLVFEALERQGQTHLLTEMGDRELVEDDLTGRRHGLRPNGKNPVNPRNRPECRKLPDNTTA